MAGPGLKQDSHAAGRGQSGLCEDKSHLGSGLINTALIGAFSLPTSSAKPCIGSRRIGSTLEVTLGARMTWLYRLQSWGPSEH